MPVSAVVAEFSYVGGTASAQDVQGIHAASLMFDNDPATGWWSGIYDPPTPNWIQMDFGAGITHKVTKYNMTARGDSAGAESPKDWIFQGSSDAATWMNLDNRTGQLFYSDATKGETKEYSSFNLASNISAYRYYRMRILKTNYPADYAWLYEWELWGDDSVADTSPPDSITSLINGTPSCSQVAYSWTNPKATDYYQLITWKNNILNGNLSNSTTTITWSTLTENTWYNFSSKTIDLSGNINASFVNGSALTAWCPVGGGTSTPTPTINETAGIPNLPKATGGNWVKDMVERNCWWLILLIGAVVILRRK
jgi:hypothetical protein